jgi:hypothetical protein
MLLSKHLIRSNIAFWSVSQILLTTDGIFSSQIKKPNLVIFMNDEISGPSNQITC